MVIALDILHVFVCLFLMLVVLLQQGKGGGLGSSFGGGGGASQVFGGSGAGNLLTRTTAVCATLFMLTSVSLAWVSSSGDRALRERARLEEQRGDTTDNGDESAVPVEDTTAPEPAPADKPAEPASTGDAPAPGDAPAAPAPSAPAE